MSADAMPAGVSFGYCWCGCRLPAPIANGTDRRAGWVKGEPTHYISGHNGRRQDLRADFYARVDLNGPIVSPELGPCGIWTGALNKTGYGQISVNGRDRRAHHVALELAGYYMIPEAFGKQQVGHLCDTRSCVRVSHLKIWTAQDDADHKVSKSRQARGGCLPQTKLDQAEAQEIRRLYAAGGITQEALGLQFGVSHPTIGRIVRGETWNK